MSYGDWRDRLELSPDREMEISMLAQHRIFKPFSLAEGLMMSVQNSRYHYVQGRWDEPFDMEAMDTFEIAFWLDNEPRTGLLERGECPPLDSIIDEVVGAEHWSGDTVIGWVSTEQVGTLIARLGGNSNIGEA